MNDFRIPPGSRVKLTFGRKVLREEMGDEEVTEIWNNAFPHVSLNFPKQCWFSTITKKETRKEKLRGTTKTANSTTKPSRRTNDSTRTPPRRSPR